MRTLVMWCPDWPVVTAGFGSSTPVAVVEVGRVVAASTMARGVGVRVGLRRREAESRCPGIAVFNRDPAREARMFEPVVAAVATLTPQVEITRPGLLAIDARGPARYFGGEKALCRQVTATAGAAMPDGNHPAPLVGVADGRFAATLAARRQTVVPAGQSAGFLASFPTSVLGLPELVDLLSLLGIDTLGDFAELPEEAVLARFGVAATHAHALACGQDDERLRAEAPADELVVATGFDPPVDRAETAAFMACSLADDLVAQLEGRGLGCVRVRIEAETEHGESLLRLWTGDGVLGATEMVERLRWQLDGWLSGTTAETAPTAGIIRLVLGADEVVRSGSTQLDLWGGASDVDRRARRGLDRLRGMLGPDAIFTAVMGGGRGPGDRVTFVPWGDPRTTGQTATLPWPGHHLLPAPALVHAVAIPIEMIDADGAAVEVSARGRLSGMPAQVSIDGMPWRSVVDWAGPWTADERWWDPCSRRRRARFQILTDTQHAHLCAVEDGRWSIEATYD